MAAATMAAITIPAGSNQTGFCLGLRPAFKTLPAIFPAPLKRAAFSSSSFFNASSMELIPALPPSFPAFRRFLRSAYSVSDFAGAAVTCGEASEAWIFPAGRLM